MIHHVAVDGRKAGGAVSAGIGLGHSLSGRRAADMYCPIVSIGGRSRHGAAFNVGGEKAGAQPARLGLDMFRRMSAKPPVREWLQIEIDQPGRPPETVERTLFAGDELTDPVGIKSRLFVVSVISGVPNRAHCPDRAQLPPLAKGDSQIRRVLRTMNMLLVASPGAVAGRVLLTDKRELRYIIDTPQVVICDLQVNGSELLVRGDLRRVSQAVVANFDQTATGRAMARAFRGIFDTQFEASLFHLLIPGTSGARRDVSAAALLNQLREPDQLRPLRNADLKKLLPRADVRDSALRELAQAAILLGPDRPIDIAGQPRVAWWRIDPRSGATIGVLDTGLHQTSTEVAETDEQVAAETAAAEVEMEPRVLKWSEDEAATIAKKLAGYSKLPADAPVWPRDPGGVIPENAPPGDRGVIPYDDRPDNRSMWPDSPFYYIGGHFELIY